MADVSKICRDLANGFAALADELDKDKVETSSRLSHIEDRCDKHESLLRDIADLINGKLG